MNKCPNCGTEFEGNFCPNCGTALAQNVCPKCKSPFAEGAKFCANCGCSLEKKPKQEWLMKAIAFCKTNWKKIAITATVLVAFALIIAIPLALEFNIFRVGKVSKINIGDDQATVEKVLGEPTENSDGSWYYLQRKAAKIYQKMNGIGEDEEDFGDFVSDLEKYDKLYTKLEKMTYSYIKVSFNGKGKVTEVFLDRKHHFDENDDYAGEKKYAKTITTDPKEIDVRQATFNGETKYEITTKISDMIYTVKYTDKSFYRRAMGYATTELSEDRTNCALQWKDKLGEYRITLPTKVTEGDVILTNESGSFKVSSRGALLSYEGYSANLVIPEGITSIASDAFQDHSEIVNVTIPESVKSIGNGAFAGCSGLTSVTIPDGVTTIGGAAFYGCSALTSITIPDSVTSIGSEAFLGCSGLTSVTIPDGVTTIGGSAFYGCSALTSITIPDSVTSIGSEAFLGCSGLTSITIPDGVTGIGDWAFEDCSGLTSVTFTGTKAQWNAISKGSSWNYNTGSYTVHCTDGDISK